MEKERLQQLKRETEERLAAVQNTIETYTRHRNPNDYWIVDYLEMEKERLQQVKRETEEKLAVVQNTIETYK